MSEQPDDLSESNRDSADRTDGPGFVLCLYRNTRDVEQMVKFLAVLGLHRSGVRDGDGFTYLWGRAGMVALYDASSGEGPGTLGETQLTFDTDDAAAAAELLGADGTEVLTIDEPDSPALGVADPSGHGIRIKESFRDAADVEDEGAVEPVDVVAVRYSDDFAADTDFFARLGFLAGPGSEHWRPLVGAGDAGVIGLHPPTGAAPGSVPPQADTPSSAVGSPALVELALQIQGDLPAVATRLEAAGHPVEDLSARVHHPALAVVDPDGVRLEVHAVG